MFEVFSPFLLFGFQLFGFWALTDNTLIPSLFFHFSGFLKVSPTIPCWVISPSGSVFIKHICMVSLGILDIWLKICLHNFDTWRAAWLAIKYLIHTFFSSSFGNIFYHWLALNVDVDLEILCQFNCLSFVNNMFLFVWFGCRLCF